MKAKITHTYREEIEDGAHVKFQKGLNQQNQEGVVLIALYDLECAFLANY